MPATFAALRINMYDVEITHILFKGYSAIFCNLRVFWGSRSVVEN